MLVLFYNATWFEKGAAFGCFRNYARELYSAVSSFLVKAVIQKHDNCGLRYCQIQGICWKQRRPSGFAGNTLIALLLQFTEENNHQVSLQYSRKSQNHV